MDELVGGRYRVREKLGSGAFGQIHLGIDIRTQEKVAIKFESIRSPRPRLHFEAKVYNELERGCTNRFPKARWYGTTRQCYALVMDLLGSNLEKLFARCGKRFSLKTVLMIASQMIKLIEYVHSKSFIHRDIKPDNITIGLGKQANQIFMIDFGISNQYKDTRTHKHIPYRDGMHMVGTAIYASVNSHDGIEISRRDDLESLGYSLVYFLKGSLPWQSVAAPSHAEYFRNVRNKKVNTSVEELCRGLPSEFKTYFRYVHGLRFDEKPDYAFLKRLFRDLFVRRGYKYDYDFDWNH